MRTFLSSVKTFYFLLAATLVLRCISEINHPTITSDYSTQMEAAKNFVRSGHLSNTWVNADNLNDIKSSPLSLWPVGICFFIAFFNAFTHNIIYSEICFQCLGAILFILGAVKLLKRLGSSVLNLNLFLLLFAFNCTPFYYLGSTDLFTGGLFLWTTLFALKYIEDKNYISLNALMIILLSFLAATVRYACIPLAIIVPFFCFLVALLKRERSFLFKGIITMAGSLLLIFIYLKFFPISSQRTGFLESMKSGHFYYSNLKWFDPFPIKSLLFTRPIEFHLPNKHLVILAYRISMLLLSFGFLLFIISDFTRNLKKGKLLQSLREQSLQPKMLLLLLFFVSFIVIAGFLSLQSLTWGPESNSFGPAWMPPLWTFVYATRYFIYLMCLVIIIYFVSLNHNSAAATMRSKINSAFYFLFLFWALAYWFFITRQFYSSSGNGAGSSWVNEKADIEAFNRINEIYKTESQPHIVYTHYEKKKIEGLVTNYSMAYPTDDYQRIINNNFNFTSPLVLMLMMPITPGEGEQRFLSDHNHTVLHTFKSEQLVRVDLR